MRRALAVFAIAASACRFDGAAPDGLIITCTDGVCPEGLACQPATSQCVPASELDAVPPGIIAGTERVTLAPAPRARVADVTRLGPGGTATVRFEVTEALDGAPVLEATPALSCAVVDGVDRSWQFACRISEGATPVTALVRLRARLRDLVGNRAEPDLSSTLTVDSEPPAAPDTSDAGVVLVREPWGSQASGGVPRARLVGVPGSAPASVTLLAQLPVTELEVARGTSGADGAFSLTSTLPDLAAAELVAIDEAGNASPPARVQSAEVVARRSAGLTAEARSVHSEALDRPDAVPLDDGAGLDAVDGQPARVTAARSWRRKTVGYPQGVFGLASAVYDSRRALVVRFIGAAGSIGLSAVDNVWEWTGEDWLERVAVDPESDGSPPARAAAAAAFDEERGVSVVFGGRFNLVAPPLGETWAWNGASWRRLSATGPAPRAGPAMAYQSDLGRSVLFGGLLADGGVTADTWAFDGRRWAELDAGPGPTARGEHAMTYDPERHRVILFGGGDGLAIAGQDGGRPLGDTWVLEGDRWRELDAGGPPPRVRIGLAWDVDRSRAVLVTGVAGDVIWELDGESWRAVVPAGEVLPDAPEGPAIAYDAARRRTVLTGATSCLLSGCPFPDRATYTWDGARLEKVSVFSPQPHSDGKLAFSQTSSQTLSLTPSLFGNLTLVLDRYWSERDAGTPPSFGHPRLIGGGAAFGALFLCNNGLASETWLYDADTRERWTLARSAFDFDLETRDLLLPIGDSVWAGLSSSVFAPPAATFLFSRDAGWRQTADAPSNFGTPVGTALGDGGAWYGGMPFGAPPEGWYVFASSDGGVGYAQGPPSPALIGPAIAFDTARQRLVSFGGGFALFTLTTALLLEEAGGSWVPLAFGDPTFDGAPGPRFSAQLIDQPNRGRLLLHGGLAGSDFLTDTWELEGRGLKPSLVLHLDLRALGLPSVESVTALELAAVAGGTGGAQLELWSAGTFRTVAQNAAAPGSPATLGFTVTDPRLIERVLLHRQSLAAAVVARSGSGLQLAEVAVDYAEVTVRYRLP